ncbi:MAG: type I polyketide synthase [Candidatus Hydrogenedentes bacterium]|nr:type I polyketide synthase [Candidatus Hydrogenedentota bacterium]
MKQPPIAIVGMGGIFPDAPDLETFWQNIVSARASARDVPPGRWLLDPDDAFDPEKGKADKVYSKRGCFIEGDIPLDFGDLDLDPALARALDPMYQVLLYAGQAAFRDAGARGWDHAHTGVILGNLALPTEQSSALARAILGRTFEERVRGASADAPMPHPLNRYVTGLPAAVLAKALGLGGGAYTLDAACASSLYALKLACDELQSGRADVMLAGGVSRPDPLYTQMGFSQLRALSPKGVCTPFDEAGDGLVVGEGAGVFVLKRLDDAIADGNTIHGVIRGIGLSNDVGGRLLAPTSEGQLRAMRAAYEAAGWDPRSVDLIECHATGTAVGDAVEVESLRQLWTDAGWNPQQCTLGSVKSNIGHTLTAAGSAALLKTLLAIRHRQLPPTASYDHSPTSWAMDSSPFVVRREASPWEAETPRRAAVSAFGFGGINAHVLVEEWTAPADSPKSVIEPLEGPDCPIAIVGLDAHFGPWRGLDAVRERLLGGGADIAPSAPANWWGVEQSAWFRRAGLSRTRFHGWGIGEVTSRLVRFKIPPKELEEMLPQQLLMLQVAVNAWEHAGNAGYGDEWTGVYIGLGLDLNTTNFNVRWSLLNEARAWRKADGSAPETEAQYVQQLRDAFGPALTANRTMGALASVVASRIARELRCGGPSFTLSGEEASGIRALECAVRALQRGEIRQAITGAVDLAGDVRAILGAHHHSPCSPTGDGAGFAAGSDGSLFGEGAAALVLKRLADAEADGDRVYGVIRGIGSAAAGGVDAPLSAEACRAALDRAAADAHVPLGSLGYIETHGSGVPAEDAMEAAAFASRVTWDGPQEDIQHCLVGAAKNDIGHTGAAAGLAGVLKATLCLHHEMLPPLRHVRQPIEALRQGASRLWAPDAPQYWLHDRAAGPRRAGVATLGVGGVYTHVILEAAAQQLPVIEQPLGPRAEGLFIVTGENTAALLNALDRLKQHAQRGQDRPIERLARDWWRNNPVESRAGLRSAALVTRSVSELLEQIGILGQDLRNAPETGIGGRHPQPREVVARDRIFFSPDPLGATGKIAFVFPGSGNHYPGMGRDLFAQWPGVLRAQDKENHCLRQQFQPDVFWRQGAPGLDGNHKAMIFGQVALGTAVSDLVRGFGIEPQIAIGYSLGETASLFALRAWRDRDLMLERIASSRLFTHELAGECDAARRAWKLPGQDTVDWVLGVIDRPMKVARQAVKNRKKVYPLIANTFQESVIGGNRKAVEKLIAKLECQFIPLEGVTTVHCDIVKEVEREYRDLHLFPTTPPPGVEYFSGAWGKAYTVNRESAADSVLAQAIDGVDFPAVIEGAWDHGARFFLEMGPGNSCSRMIQRILADRPHLARPICHDGAGAVSLVLRALGQLVAEGMPVNLDALYSAETEQPVALDTKPTVTVPVGGAPFAAPELPRPAATAVAVRPIEIPITMPQKAQKVTPSNQSTLSTASTLSTTQAQPAGASSALLDSVSAAEAATAAAHAQYLRFAGALQDTLAAGIRHAMAAPAATPAPEPTKSNPPAQPAPDLVFDRDQCMEFAIGAIGKMLGPRFAEIDRHPTRVRLPDEPLMLVDRITALEGEPGSMGSGRVVTEHDVLPNGWYLDGGHIPTCIAVEAGQADLFLSGYLGIDFQTKGLAMYRLLDAEVTFHDHTPVAGQVIRYDIHIDRFFRHGNPWFFHFWFDATVEGKPLMSMRNGCAGFFTEEDLAAGQGVVDARLDRENNQGVLPADWRELVPMQSAAYNEDQVNALRIGNLAGCFGEAFRGLPLQNPVRIPDGRMNLVHRVVELTPGGGRYGLGKIVAEADIHPDDWFITCHFVDDRVMPGTLMFECCLHTLRIYLMRMGWVAEADSAYWEPKPGVTGRLKCRGQVLETTKRVTYEVNIKELGYGPAPYAIADARMYADGKAIVDINNMSIQLQGQTREGLEALWAGAAPNFGAPKPPVYTFEQILAFSQGNPSEAFGAPYAIFDAGQPRKIARLPRPPFQFLDRITDVTGEPFELKAGAAAEAQYDIPPGEWYFTANRQPGMPFAVLLEIALQPCGWLAAYCGSALTSETDLKFRNLGGKAIQRQPVDAETGTITIQVKMTAVSTSGGMIIQHYDMAVHGATGCLYEGTTYFGFFSEAALADQVGIREALRYTPSDAEQNANPPFDYPAEAPFPDGQWCMLDRIVAFAPEGGPQGLGFIRGVMKVDPEKWFFQAHFYEDPVCPGSLGLESFLQLLKVAAARRWNLGPDAVFETIAIGEEHEWIYRGQVIPKDNEVTVEAVITRADDANRLIHADGFLIVDGRVIYQMKHFSLRARE